jgi:phospholipid transport system substrate-binding protein
MRTNELTHRLVLGAAILFWSLAAAANSPNSVIEDAAELLDQEVSGNKEELANDREALYTMIDGILLPRFDRKYAAQLVLGKHWKTATPEQRERFIDAFYTALLRKYSDGVLQFDASRIEILEFRGDLSKPRAVVKTIVRLDDGTKVPVNYGMVNRDSGWLMFDVTIEGISYVRNFRAELNSEINTGSIDSVITRLETDAGTSSSE